MAKFKFIDTGIQGLTIVEPTVFGDERGYFMETYNSAEFASAGLPSSYLQDNQSMSRKGVLRGLHFQNKNPQGKLVRVVSGEVYDIAVDLRQGSATFGRHYGILLSAKNRLQFYVPEGFAHGFLVLSDTAEFVYKRTRLYTSGDEGGLLWNDPELKIAWPLDGMVPILSEKDKVHPSFSDYKKNLRTNGEKARG